MRIMIRTFISERQPGAQVSLDTEGFCSEKVRVLSVDNMAAP